MHRFIAASLLFCCGCSNPDGSTTSTAEAQPKPWYSGGNLSNKTGTEWLAATPENRLATSADMYFSLNKPADMAEFESARPNAANLETCITKTLTPPDDVPKEKWAVFQERPVAEMALSCMTLLKYR
jgi:hypothetical protein